MRAEGRVELVRLLKAWNLSDEDGPLTEDGLGDLADDIARVVDRDRAAWLRDLADEVSP